LFLRSVRLAAFSFFWVAVATGQVAILQIRVVEGEGGVHPPGSRSSRPIVVEITDETGKPVPGAAVSFHLPEDGPGGVFVNGLRTEVVITDAGGRAGLRGLVANHAPGRFQIRILASKEQARAGTVSFQYVAEPRGGTTVAKSASLPGRRKWLAVAAAVGGGAVAGMIAMRGGGASPSAASPATPVPASPTIGNPTITVGKP
jgi:hypothetical protein